MLKYLMLVPVLALLVGCGETRFGERVSRDEHGRLPPISTPPVTDQSEKVYQDAKLAPQLASEDGVENQWGELRRYLQDDSKREKRRLLGRLLQLAALDTTELRLQIVQLWAMQYLARLDGINLKDAEQILIDKVIKESDFICFIRFGQLFHLVTGERPFTEAQEENEKLANQFFLYGKEADEHP